MGQPILVPIIENIHQKVFDAASKPSALKMTEWHTCDTTHCRAGWVIVLAGEEGSKLEKFFCTALAALKIYKASGYEDITFEDFYKTNEEALEDMKQLAEKEV